LGQKQQFYNAGVWSAAYSVGATYDKVGHTASLTYPSGHTTNYSYDVAGRTSSFSGNLGEGVQRTYANDFQYSEWGGVQQEKFATDTPLFHKQRFNQRGQLWDMRLSSVSFAADPANGDRGALVNYYSDNFAAGGSNDRNNGNLLRQDIFVPGNGFFRDDFSYTDPLNRLTSVSERLNGVNESFRQSYWYDRWGNRLIEQANTTANVPHPQYTLDPANNNHLLAPAGYTHEYDAAGNQTRDTYTTASPTAGYRTFDAENRVIAAQKPVSGKVSWSYYTYDGDGLRVRRKIATFEIWQIYGFAGELLAEYPQNGSSLAIAQPQKEYGYRNGQLLVTTEPYINSAWGKPATQTDNLNGTTTAAKAVDGDVEGELSEERAAATNSHANAWWESICKACRRSVRSPSGAAPIVVRR
jgi:YD repeat-containing protein